MEEKDNTTRRYTPEQKVKIVKEALTTDIGVSGVCRKYGISSGLFYKWQEKFFAGALEGFRQSKDGPSSAEIRKIESLEMDNQRMKSVIAEITAENIDFKKKAWGLLEGSHVPTETRKLIIDDLKLQEQRTGFSAAHLLKLYGIQRSTFYGWSNKRIASPPKRRNVLAVLPEEEKAVLDFRQNL